MEYLAIIAFAVFATYVVCVCLTDRIPTMLSGMYYMTGRIFSILLSVLAFSFLPPMLDSNGVQCAAFLTCAGLLFVATAPAYLDAEELKVHKGGAIVSALASILWACSISVIPTIIFAILAIVLCIYKRSRWLFWIECAAILNIITTLFAF